MRWKKPLPRAAACLNITCRWREEVGGEEKEESPQRAHRPRNRGRSKLIINKAGKKRKSDEVKAQDGNHIIVARSSRMLPRALMLGDGTCRTKRERVSAIDRSLLVAASPGRFSWETENVVRGEERRGEGRGIITIKGVAKVYRGDGTSVVLWT